MPDHCYFGNVKRVKLSEARLFAMRPEKTHLGGSVEVLKGTISKPGKIFMN
jgi:hypothetical protein